MTPGSESPEHRNYKKGQPDPKIDRQTCGLTGAQGAPLEFALGNRLPAVLTPKHLLFFRLIAAGNLQGLGSECDGVKANGSRCLEGNVRNSQGERSLPQVYGQSRLRFLHVARQIFVVPAGVLERFACGGAQESAFPVLVIIQVIAAEFRVPTTLPPRLATHPN